MRIRRHTDSSGWTVSDDVECVDLCTLVEVHMRTLWRWFGNYLHNGGLSMAGKYDLVVFLTSSPSQAIRDSAVSRSET